MPMPLWWGQINKRLFNPRALENGKWKVLTHVGRTSGKTYRTPLDGREVDGTYVFIIVYGLRSDWVQNTVASGYATLDVGDELVELGSPRILRGAAGREKLEGFVRLPPGFMKVDEFLQMDIVSRRPKSVPDRVNFRG
jgi:deazaflavin-dependent oxidoreductase (nitroreductase family)